MHVADLYKIEFKKRGLPHAHILLMLDEKYKLVTPDDGNNIIFAKILDPKNEPEAYDTLKRCMIYGPCRYLNPRCVCMVDGKCTMHYPKPFTLSTPINADEYLTYRRRDNGITIEIVNVTVDNHLVVPYNLSLLRKINAYINVEICNRIRVVKYLYKYIHKGED